MTPTAEVKKVEVEKVTVKKPYFDLSTFERKTKEVEVAFTPVSTEHAVSESLARLGGNKEKLAELLNQALKRDLVISGRSEISLGENEVPVGIVQGFVKNFLPMFSKEATKKAQRAKAIAFVRGNAGLLEALKTYAKAVIEAGATIEEDDEEDGENDAK